MFNRRIYFISGFDPRGARFYHRLFREEAKKSERLSGATILTGKRKLLDSDITQWQVNSVWNNESYAIDYRFLNWDGVMKHYWVGNVWLLIIKSIFYYCKHIVTGEIFRLKAGGKGPFLFGLAPLGYAVASTLLSILVGVITYHTVFVLLNSVVIASAFAIVASYFVAKYAVNFGERLGIWWVLQTYFLLSRWGDNGLIELEERMQIFAHRILQDQQSEPVDEIVLVGHCVGASLTVGVMANILNMQHDALKGKLSVLTLGQCIPYISYALKAHHFRKSLQLFANNNVFPWYDMGARADPLCFQQVNPAQAEGITLKNQNVPYQFVVRPYKMFSEEKYRDLQKSKLRIHFQYLMAADIKTDFDYFEIVTGHPDTLKNYRT